MRGLFLSYIKFQERQLINESIKTKNMLSELWTRGGENVADYKLTLAEKEALVLWSEADNTVQIDTFSQKLIKRLRKQRKDARSFIVWTSLIVTAVYMQKCRKSSCRYPSVNRSAKNAASSMQGSQKSASTPKIKQGC